MSKCIKYTFLTFRVFCKMLSAAPFFTVFFALLFLVNINTFVYTFIIYDILYLGITFSYNNKKKLKQSSVYLPPNINIFYFSSALCFLAPTVRGGVVNTKVQFTKVNQCKCNCRETLEIKRIKNFNHEHD